MNDTTSILGECRTIEIKSENNLQKTRVSKNRIVSHKYTIWSFIPRNLFEQFRRIANFYFFMTALAAVCIESPISPLTSSIPLAFVITVTACKQGYEDYNRYKRDKRINRKLVTVIRNKCVQNIYCEQIVAGDIVKLHCDEDVPCDIVLLHSSEDSGVCFVTTSNLDGETNLKMLCVPKLMSDMNLQEIISLKATITCQQPTANLYDFHGKLELPNDTENLLYVHLTIDNMLLRGAQIKDTNYVVGCAVYIGEETKLSLNSKTSRNKFSTAERSINRYLIVYVGILFIEILMSTVYKLISESKAKWNVYLGENTLSAMSIINDILSFMILFNYVVPISLYVTIELQKFLGSFFFSWDIELYDENSDQIAVSNTSDLNEELGQVEYLFTDKTGTLTENLMVFRRCSVNGNMYMERNCDGNFYQLPQNGDEIKAVRLEFMQPDILHLLIAISLCHMVRIMSTKPRAVTKMKRIEYRKSFRMKKITRVNSSLLMDPDLPEYQATSADEKALVEATARCGVVFQKETNQELEIKTKDSLLVFRRLEILEFTADRKRMSVIVQDAEERLWLYCKGADSSVLPLIIEGDVDTATLHIEEFAMGGLRTLVYAYKQLQQEEYKEIIDHVETARQTIGKDRETKVMQAYERVERNLSLLGVTAVEDRLQEGVEDTLEALRVAGIKIWMLTGDKATTAENIAFLCGHFKNGTEILKLIDEESIHCCYVTLISFDRKIQLEPCKQYGLIIDGTSLGKVIKICPNLFRKVALACESVICCRLTPLQKSEVVKLIKEKGEDIITAAIGDGGNDVFMIQEAHVGIGITGKEGRQAAMSADFAFAKFKHLKKALLVHGHWYYLRISILIQYFFYKNMVFITPQLLYCIHNGFSTQALYDGMFLMLFNVLFTSFPIIVYGLLEQDYSAQKLLKYPYLYKMYKRNELLSKKQFILWTSMSIWQACVIYFSLYLYVCTNAAMLHNSTPFDHWTFSTTIFHIVVMVINLQILVFNSYWSVPFISSIFLSELLFFFFAFFYSISNLQYDGDMLYVFPQLLQSSMFWLMTVVICVTCIIPTYLIRIYQINKINRIPRRNEETPINIKPENSHS